MKSNAVGEEAVPAKQPLNISVHVAALYGAENRPASLAAARERSTWRDRCRVSRRGIRSSEAG